MNAPSATARLGRRRFLAQTAAVTTAAALKPTLVFGTDANSALELGLIGCGGRGTWIAKLFQDTGQYRLAACADYFQDRVDAAGEKFNIGLARRYSGLSGYKRLLDSQLDAVVIETPPYFHPEHAAAAVDAGKHTFLAKPIAVDVPGCNTIAESGKRATASKLVFLVDFQTRANEFYREAVRRVRHGDLGDLILGEAHYPWRGGGRGAPPTTLEERLRSWYYVRELSGDFIVEQSIHALDVATWILNADPIRAAGGGGRKVRPANSVGNLYTTGAQTNIREFYQLITSGQYENLTVAPSVRSNLTAILGREAGYRGGQLTWTELLKENKKLELDLTGVKG